MDAHASQFVGMESPRSPIPTSTLDLDALEHALREKGLIKEINRTFNLIAIPLLIMAVLGVGFILVWAREILVPFVIALFFTYLLKPMVNALSQPVGSCTEANCLNFFNPVACRRRTTSSGYAGPSNTRKDSSGELNASFANNSLNGFTDDDSAVLSSVGKEVELSNLIEKVDTLPHGGVGSLPTRSNFSTPSHNQTRSLCFRCSHWKLPRWFSILLSMALVGGFFAGVVILIADAVQTFEDEDVELFEDQMVDLGFKLKSWMKRVFGIEIKSLMDQFRAEFHWVSLTKTLVLAVLGGLEYAFIIFLFVMYMLFEDSDLNSNVETNLSRSHSKARDLRRQIDMQIQRYIVIKTLISLLVGVSVYIVLGPMLGVKMAHIFGVVTFFANFVPNVGAMLATIVPIPMIVLDPQQTTISAILAIALPVFIHSVVGNVVEPKVFGDTMELHPVVVLISLSFWYTVWGMAGAILSVPITAVLRIVLSHIKHPYANVLLHLLEGKLPGSRAFHMKR